MVLKTRTTLCLAICLSIVLTACTVPVATLEDVSQPEADISTDLAAQLAGVPGYPIRRIWSGPEMLKA